MNYCQFRNDFIKRMCNSIKPLLPPEYQQVEWIQGGNGQYIDTGEVPTSTLGIEAEGRFGVEGGDYFTLLGCRVAISNGYVLQGLTSGFRLVYGASLNTIAIYDCTWFSFRPSVTKTFYYRRDGGVTGSAAISGTAPAISQHFYICALNNNGAAVGGSAQFGNFKMYAGDSLIHDYYACYRKSDNKPGMYDLVTSTFLTNAGTGEFTVGNPV